MTDAQAGPPIPVELSNEYMVDLPLWAPDGLPPEDTYPISEGLRARLMDWAAIFNEHFDHVTGWDSEPRRVAHRAEGLSLHRQLVDELGPGYDVSFSLWDSDVHGAEALLAGPRGPRLCLELAAAQQERIWTAMVTASWFFDLEQGTPYWLMALDGADAQAPDEEDDNGEDGTLATTADAAVRELVRVLSEFARGEMGVPSAEAVHEALAKSVDSARYWQEPDGVDVLAAQHRVRNALVPIADQVMQSEPARSWTAGRGVEQWVIDWRSTDDLAPLVRDPARILADWGREVRAEEAHAAVERPRDPAAPWCGTWWAVPLGLIHSVGRIPEGLDLIEDRAGEELATVIPVRGSGTVYEVRTEYDWTWLCEQFPLEVTASRRHDWFRTTGRNGRWVIPDWEQVSTRFDAVHLTILGYLSAAGRELSVNLRVAPGEGVATVLAGWDPDATIWLTDSVWEGEGPRQSWRWSESDGAWVRES